MTISLSVILMETTGVETSFFFPLIIALISAKWVGDYFNDGIYDTVIEVNHVPMLPWEPLPQYKGLTAEAILSKPVVCIKLRDRAHYIYKVLQKCNHNGFPVVDDVQGVSSCCSQLNDFKSTSCLLCRIVALRGVSVALS